MYKKYYGGFQDLFTKITNQQEKKQKKQNTPPPSVGKSVNAQQFHLVTGDYSLQKVRTSMQQSISWFQHSL